MSIASELTALNGYILDAYDEVTNKGGTVPQNKNMANLAAAIASISGGGGSIDLSGFLGCTKAVTGSFGGSTPGTSYYREVTHNLGITPKVAIYVISDPTDLASSTSSSKRALFGAKIQTGQFVEGSYLLDSGVFVEVGVGAYASGAAGAALTVESFFRSPTRCGSNDYYHTSLYATSFKSSSFLLTAYKATATTITFYRGVKDATLSSQITYNYLVAG